jgi:hypothetical protein
MFMRARGGLDRAARLATTGAVIVGLAMPGAAMASGPLLDPPEKIAVDMAARTGVVVLDFDGDGVPDLASVGRGASS